MEWTGKDVEKFRNDTGVTKSKLSRLLEVSSSLVGQWENKPSKRLPLHYWKRLDKLAADTLPTKKEIKGIADEFFVVLEGTPAVATEDKTDSMCRRVHKIFAMLAEMLCKEDIERLKRFDPADEEAWEIANEVYLRDYKDQLEELNALNSKVIQMENSIGAALDQGGLRIVEKLRPPTSI